MAGMKKRIIKKYIKSKIEEGWRYYLTLKIPYDIFGLNQDSFLKISDIENVFNLKWKEDSGFVNHYRMTDGLETVNLSFDWSFRKPIEFNDQYYIEDDGTFYYMSGSCGIQNPEWSKENKSTEYWLKDSFYRWTITQDDSEEEKELIEKFKNSKLLIDNFFSGNFIYSILSGKNIEDIDDNLFRELSELSNLCKTIYIEHKENHFELCYAIRYKDYINKFVSDLTQIILKYKLNYKQFL